MGNREESIVKILYVLLIIAILVNISYFSYRLGTLHPNEEIEKIKEDIHLIDIEIAHTETRIECLGRYE